MGITLWCSAMAFGGNVMEGKHETEVNKCNNQNDEAKSDSKRQ